MKIYFNKWAKERHDLDNMTPSNWLKIINACMDNIWEDIYNDYLPIINDLNDIKITHDHMLKGMNRASTFYDIPY